MSGLRWQAVVWSIVLGGFIVLASVPAYAAASSASPARYEQAKSKLERLYDDSKRSAWREPWLKLAQEFYTIYVQEKNWINRPAALYRSALAFDELSRRSRVRKDTEEAISRYLRLADTHRTNPLVDDALLRTARLQSSILDDTDAALATVERLCRQFAKSQTCADGQRLAAGLGGKTKSSAEKTATPPQELEELAERADGGVPRIRRVAWNTSGKTVKITISLSRSAPWELRSHGGQAKGDGPRLILDLYEARADASVPPGSKIRGSSLQRIRLDAHKSGQTRVLIDFSRLASFSVREEDGGKTLVIHTAPVAASLPGGLEPGNVVRSSRAAAAERRKAQVRQNQDADRALRLSTRNLASQFGLNVRRIIIDPGHGGKDPGTHHNKVLERELTLDLAQRLGKKLRAEGFDVRFTRTRNAWVSLNDRVEFANREKGDLFLSLHVNASPNPKKSGFETYYLDISNNTAAASLASFENMLSNRKLGDLEKMISDLMLNARKDESVRLARDVQQKTLARLTKQGFSVENGGSRGAPFVVLMGTSMPAVLIEVGYCTNPQEAKRLNQGAFRNALVQGMSNGVITYADRLQNGQGK